VADRLPSTASDVWDQHRVAIVFVASVFGLTLLFGLILLLLKCRETSVAGDRQQPTTEDRTVVVNLTSAEHPPALQDAERDGRKRWREKLTELLRQQIRWSSATGRQSQLNCELMAAA